MSELSQKLTTPASSITEAIKGKPRPANDWIQTYTGKAFYPLAPRVEDVCIEDIAHALSMKCRFCGHCREFYSVAQHSVMVSNLLQAHLPQIQLAGLLHDAAEAYLPDVCRPIKKLLFVGSTDLTSIDCESFSDAEDRVMEVICAAFSLPWPFPADWSDIKHANNIMLATEARDLMSAPPKAWEKLPAPLTGTVFPFSPRDSKADFIRRFNTLRTAVQP